MDTNSKKATAFVLEKLNSAGIEVITDKEEFDRILENEKILQKMTADLSEFENLSSQLTERKQEANELEYKKNKIIENKEKQKSEDFKNLNEKILNYEKYLPDDAVINLSRKNEVKNNTPEQTYQLIKSNGIMLYQTTSINEEQHSIYDILFNEEIEPKEFKSFYSNTDFSTLKNEIEDIIKDFLKDQIEKQKAKTEQLKNFIEHSKEFNNEEQHNDNILINLSNLEKSLFFNANFEINSKELNEEVSVFPGSTGKSGMGIRHIIEERFKKDNLTIDQITSLAALILDAVQTGNVTRESRNRCEFTKNGIIAIVKKNFDNSKINWILTGFAYKGESRNKEREATEAIQTVNARYGHSPEYSSFRIQVGAVITSLNQSITETTIKSSQDYIPDTQNGKMIVTSLKTELKPETHFIRNSSDVYKLLNEVADQEQEHFGVILLDTSHKVTAVKTLFIGTLNRSLAHPRDIFREALRANAAAIIVFHNHPSGTLYPSQEDINTTERLMRASRNIGIPLLDHLIVTKDNYRSLSDVMESIERKLDNEKNNEFLIQDGKTYGFVHEGKIYLDPEVMAKVFACDALEREMPARLRSEPAGEYDRVLGIEGFFEFIYALPAPYDQSIYAEFQFQPEIVKFRTLLSAIRTFRMFSDQKENEWLHAGLFLRFYDKTGEILAVRDRIAEEYPGAQYSEARGKILANAIVIFLSEGKSSEENLEAFSRDVKELRNPIIRLARDYNSAVPEEKIRIRDTILEQGLPGDPVVRRMWGFKKYSR